jgi:DNA-binding winged helix-turn-helix (wHTH) protein
MSVNFGGWSLPHPSSLFRFGVFELDGRTGELRKNGRNGPRLAGQPLELLLQLLERPGELVSREEIRQRLWPADTFVDYDHSLNAAVNKLREALSDAADNPRFIQTIPRRGYRFIAPVEFGEGAATVMVMANRSAAAAAPPDAAIRQAAESYSLLSDPGELPAIPHGYSRLLFALLQTMYLSFYVLAMANLGGVDAALRHLLANPSWVLVLVIVTACAGIPLRLYLLSGAAFGFRGLTEKFRKLFPFVFLLDELWSLSPLLIVDRIGWGLALAATASLVFLPFSQRSVLLMGDGAASHDLQR